MKNRTSAKAKRIFINFTCFGLFLMVLWGYLHFWNAQPTTSQNVQPIKAPNLQVTVPAPTVPGKWQLTFDDEFNGSGLDESKWNIEDNGVGGYQNCCVNYGGQYYTPEALSFVDGSLRITTERKNKGTNAYTSGAITTENKFSFLYGRVDIRAKLPKTQGLWPAFWLLPSATNARLGGDFEIDVMEFRGSEPNTIHMTNHWGKQQTGQNYIENADYSQDYHVFTVVWTPSTITWYIDSLQRYQTSQGVSNQSMYLIINTTIGGHWGGIPDASTALPQYLNLNYVRIYKPIA